MNIENVIEALKNKKKNCNFNELVKICGYFFEKKPSSKGGSHQYIYKTPWIGDPRINVQKGKDSCAKSYQVEQIIKALEKLNSGNK